MTETIYAVPLPEATTPTERKGLGTQLAEQGVLGGDAIVDALSSEAGDLTLTGRYAFGKFYSELLATELEELGDSSLSALPLYGGKGSRSGYYEVENATAEPVHAGGRDVWEWDLSLTKKGTRKSHLQAVETTVTQPDPGHEFGNDQTAEIAIPSAARSVRIVDSLSSPTERERPDSVRTVETEFGDVDIYDADDEEIDDPIYIYDVEADIQPAVDAHVYDTNGRDSKFIEADEGRVRAWQSVYARDHEFNDSAVVLENGLLRIIIDEPTNDDETADLEVEEYDPDGPAEQLGTGLYGDDEYGDGLYAGTRGAYSAVDLPAYDDGDGDLDTDWEPVDVDLTHIGQARVAAQIEFEAVAGDDEGDVYSVDVELERGRETLEVWIPESVDDPIPDDLEELLEEIASESVEDSGVEQTTVAREEVRL